eukprot:403352947
MVEIKFKYFDNINKSSASFFHISNQKRELLIKQTETLSSITLGFTWVTNYQDSLEESSQRAEDPDKQEDYEAQETAKNCTQLCNLYIVNKYLVLKSLENQDHLVINIENFYFVNLISSLGDKPDINDNLQSENTSKQTVFELHNQLCHLISMMNLYCIQQFDQNSCIIKRKLGQGSQGSVYKIQLRDQNKYTSNKSTQTSQKFNYAVKLINKFDEREESQQLVINEIQILRKFKKRDIQGIAHIHQVMEDEQYLYIVLGYKNGGDLKQKVKKRGNLNEFQAKQVCKQLLVTLHQIHCSGILHKDLTPYNVLFDGRENFDDHTLPDVCIIDFGLSQNQKQLREQVNKCGTPGYIAPEGAIFFKAKKMIRFYGQMPNVNQQNQ